MPDVVLDLQAAVNRAYEAGPYIVRVAYGEEPEPPLPESDRAWAEDILKQAGLRQ